MGRKKIEIRPLGDERNRNVTFLKRKAGLMKKAWELSVLCGADVNILIFNAAGKAYEFSSKDLDEEIDRYMDYEGMIERRRAPEFAAMALAGEDEEDEEDEEPSNRRGSTSKAGANANANANGAPTRSLKGKESFKSRTPRFAEKGKSKSNKNTKSKNGRSRRKERSESEKRSFIDSILSQSSSSGSSSDDDDEDEGSQGNQAELRRRRKDKERRERERERERRRMNGGGLDEERGYHHSDKSAAALQYAMNMHSSQSHHQPNHHDPRYTQHQHMHLNGRDRYHDEISESRHSHSSQIPVDIPQLPKLPSDGASYRSLMTSGISNNGQPSQTQYYGPSSSHQGQYVPNQNQNMTSYSGQGFLPINAPSEPPCSLILPSQSFVSPPNNILPSHSHSQQNGFGQSPSNPSLTTTVPGAGSIQWNENLIAKYAEFQLQQNHQKQQRLLLERQRYQLQQMGVPIDERSLLDDIFGGNLSQAQSQSQSQSQGQGQGHHHPSIPSSVNSYDHSGERGEMILPLEESNEMNGGGGGDFVWPLSNPNNRGHQTPSIDDPNSQSQNNPFNGLTQQAREDMVGGVQWGVQDGYTVDRDDLNLPSPVSNGPGPGPGVSSNGNEGKRKYRKEDGNNENLNMGVSGKRIRM